MGPNMFFSAIWRDSGQMSKNPSFVEIKKDSPQKAITLFKIIAFWEMCGDYMFLFLQNKPFGKFDPPYLAI